MIIMIFIAIGMSCLEKFIPDVIYMMFAYPAAHLASIFFGSKPVLANSVIVIPMLNYSIEVIPACSAYGFFCLLYAMIVSYVFRKFKPRKACMFSLAAAPLAYLITVTTNSCRIICAYHVHELGKIVLPANFQAALHQGVGIIMFLSVMMGVYLLLEKDSLYERR